MFKLYGFFKQDSMKTLYGMEKPGCDYEFAFAGAEQYRLIDRPLEVYENVQLWADRIESRDSVAHARARLLQ